MKKAYLIAILMAAVVMSGCKNGNDPTGQEQYADAAMWCERPTTNSAKVDVFYVVSTVIMHSYNSDSTEVFRAVLTDEEKSTMDKEIRSVKSDIFPDSLNFYSPYYHQCTMAATALPKEEMATYFQKGVEEIIEAFDYYMAHYNQGRPFILAGYSQGAILTTKLLLHLTDDQYKHLVAAYVMGYGLSKELLDDPHINAATGADDTGVTISYNSTSNPDSVWTSAQNNAVTCINPVNWKTDETPKDFDFDGEPLNVYVDTTVQALIVSGFNVENHPWIKEWEINPFPKGNYHNYEITFYNDYLRANALNRCRHFAH